MTSKALSAALLDVTARTSASADDTVEGLSGRRLVAIQIDANGTAAGDVVIYGSLRAASANKFVPLATVTLAANVSSSVHTPDAPFEAIRLDYGAMSAGAVDVLVKAFVEDH